jgi:hypothetical protein
MSERYVEVSRESFISRLEQAGFKPDPEARGELVYQRQHDLDPTMFVKIYTSLPLNGGDVRPAGADAIRVLLVFNNPRTGRSGCLFKASRVYRTGTEAGVLDRTLQRARECWADGNRRARGVKKPAA